MIQPPPDFLQGFIAVFSPGMILFPLFFVLAVPTKVQEDQARQTARQRQSLLAICTAIAFSISIGLTIAARQTRNPLFDQGSRMAWLLFFPLWFGLGMRAVVAKNPAWGAVCQPGSAEGPPVRTASLKPRHRENPVRKWHWAVMVAATVVPLTFLAIRGTFPFAPAGPAADAAHYRWALLTGIFGICMLITLPIVPLSIRMSLVEPEPLDPSGSSELEAMYTAERRKRILSLFWLLGVAQPIMLGALFNAMVWGVSASGRTLGIIGAVGGTCIGLAGSMLGIVATLHRVRIAEAKARLESTTNVR